MALKDIFTMVKADRYTADGREEVNKAREVEIEDRRYNNGEISEKTGLMKTPNGWVKPKNGKQPGAKKESKPGRKMSNGEISERKTKGISVEGIGEGKSFKNENGAKIDITGTGADGSIQFMVTTSEGTKQSHHARSKEEMERILSVNGYAVESKPDAGSESNPGNYPGWKPNKVESMGDGKYRIEGTQFYFNTPEEAQTAILAKARGDRSTYARPSKDKTINEIQNALGFKLDTEYGGKHSMDDFMKKTGKDEYGVRVWSFGTDSKGTLIDYFGAGSYAEPNATIKKENGEWKLFYKDRDGKETVVTATGRKDPTRDAAPRTLTGDCRIRVRKA